MTIEQDKASHISAILNKMKFTVEKGTLSITNIGPINKTFLIDYLNSYYIPLPLAKKYARELQVFNKKSGKHFYALGFKNDDDGYEICNQVIRGYVAPRAITFIPGYDEKSKSIHIFRDGMDFLSLATGSENGKLKSNSLILNSLNLWQELKHSIYSPRYNVVYTWLNHSKKETQIKSYLDEFCASETIRHIPMNHKYAPLKSITDWRVQKLSRQL